MNRKSGRGWLQRLMGTAPLVLAMCLSACGTLSNPVSPDLLTAAQMADQKNGIVLLSTGADDECVSFSTSLLLQPKGAKYNRSVKMLIPVDAYVMKSDFSDRFGFVSAFALPAGDYFLTPWLANPYFSANRSPRYDFSVGAGEVVYLGQYHQPGRCAVGDGVITNQWSRDREMIASQNPALDLSAVSIRLLRYSGDAVTGEDAPPASTYEEVRPARAPSSLDNTAERAESPAEG